VLSVSTALERLRDCLSDDFPPSSGTRIFDILSLFMTLLTRFCGAVIKRSGRSFTGSSAMAMKSLPRSARSKPSRLWPGSRLLAASGAGGFTYLRPECV
jgi:hypothetical protein